MSASASQINTVQPPQIIGSYPDSAAKILNYQVQKLQQRQREEQELHRFTEEWQIQPEKAIISIIIVQYNKIQEHKNYKMAFKLKNYFYTKISVKLFQ